MKLSILILQGKTPQCEWDFCVPEENREYSIVLGCKLPSLDNKNTVFLETSVLSCPILRTLSRESGPLNGPE